MTNPTPPRDNDWRQLSCGCWERRIQGDIVTSQVNGWIIAKPCKRHADRTADYTDEQAAR